jgi:hypothetical protein
MFPQLVAGPIGNRSRVGALELKIGLDVGAAFGAQYSDEYAAAETRIRDDARCQSVRPVVA